MRRSLRGSDSFVINPVILSDYLTRIIKALSRRERRVFWLVVAILIIAAAGRLAIAIEENSSWQPVTGGSYTEGLIGQPNFINPIISGSQIDQDLSALVYLPLSEFVATEEVQEKGQVHVISLKEDLKWSDGRPLTADDVVFSLGLIQNQEVASPLALRWQGAEIERISEIKVKFTLPAAYGFFGYHLQKLPVLPVHIFGQIPTANLKLSDYNLKPVGSGPYQFKSLEKKSTGLITEYRFTINPYYQRKTEPRIKNVIFKFYENEEQLISAFRLRKIDGFGTLKPSIFQEKLPEYAQTISLPMPRYYALFFNPSVNPAFKDKTLRLALAESVDKAELTKLLFGENGQPVYSPFGQPIAEEPFPVFDPTAAAERLAASRTLEPEEIELNIAVPEIGFLQTTAEFIKQAWTAVGFAKINIISFNTDEIVNDIIKTRNYEILLFGQSLENPLDLLPFWHSSQKFYPGSNLALYESAKVDALIETVRQRYDAGNPIGIDPQLAELENQITKDIPAVFLYSLPYVYVHNDKLNGLEASTIANPADRFRNIADWYVLRARVIE